MAQGGGDVHRYAVQTVVRGTDSGTRYRQWYAVHSGSSTDSGTRYRQWYAVQTVVRDIDSGTQYRQWYAVRGTVSTVLFVDPDLSFMPESLSATRLRRRRRRRRFSRLA